MPAWAAGISHPLPGSQPLTIFRWRALWKSRGANDPRSRNPGRTRKHSGHSFSCCGFCNNSTAKRQQSRKTIPPRAPPARAVFMLAHSLPPANAPGQPGQTGTLGGNPILALVSAVPANRDRPDFHRDTPGHFIAGACRNVACADRPAALLIPQPVPPRPVAHQQPGPAIARAPAVGPGRRAGRRTHRSAGECPAAGHNAGSS